jgi:hypothetical protein
VINGLHADFVWRLLARNLALLVYHYFVAAPIIRRGGHLLRTTPEAA